MERLEGTLVEEKKKWNIPWNSILAVILKWGKFPLWFGALKTLKSVKYLTSVWSFFVSAIVYGIALGPWFGVGFISMLLIHEMGHVWAARRRGMQTSLPLFIPFFGAALFMPDQSKRTDEAFIGFGGPFIGGVVALALFCFCLLAEPSGKLGEILMLVAYVGIWLNVFNMIPIRPLDGGRILQVSGRSYKWIGCVILLYFSIMIGHAGMLLVWILVIDDMVKRPTIRFMFGGVFYLAMLGMILFGMGDKELWVDILDIVLGCVIVFYYAALARVYVDEREQGLIIEPLGDTRPFPRLLVRFGWVLAYLALASILIGAIVTAQDYLPEQVMQSGLIFKR